MNKRYFVVASVNYSSSPSIGDVSFKIVTEEDTIGQNVVGEYPTDGSKLSIRIRTRMIARIGSPEVHAFINKYNLPI